jgi:hypothetical protein
MCSLSRLYTPSVSIDGDGGYSVDRKKKNVFLACFLSVKAAYAVFICVLIQPGTLPLGFFVWANIAFRHGFSPGFEDGLGNGNIIFLRNFDIRGVGFHD